tara:strand:- start:11 stop:2635 length:2625 start_codon:yes stop_codon:yes gene_type:complete
MSADAAASSGTTLKLTKTQWLICVIATIGFLFDIYELLMLPLIVKPALAELIGTHVVPGSPEWTTWVGRLFYIPAIVGGIFGMLGGWLTDRFGRRRVLTFSILLYAFAAFFAGFSTSPWQLLFFRCLVFIGVCVEFVAAVAWLAELFPDKQLREKVLGYTQAFSSVGGLSVAIVYHWLVQNAETLPVIPNLFGAILDPQADWRYTLMSGLIPAIPLIIIRPFLPESPQWEAKKNSGQLKRPSFGELFTPELRRTTIVATVLFAMAYGAAFGALQQVQRIIPGLSDVQTQATEKLQAMSDGDEKSPSNPVASTILAGRVAKGIGTEADSNKAISLLEKAAEAKPPYQSAQLQLGLLHLMPAGLDAKALSTNRKGRPIALSGMLGLFPDASPKNRSPKDIEAILSASAAVDQNATEGLQLVQAAADKKDADAMHLLGRMHLVGKHAEKDSAKGILLLTGAADKYHPAAMAALGKAILDAEAITPDHAKAFKWLTLASRFRSQQATAQPALAELEKVISPEDRAKGLKAVNDFEPPQRPPAKVVREKLAALKKKENPDEKDKAAIGKFTRILQIGAAKSTVPRINKENAAKVTKVQEVGGMYGRVVMALLIMVLLVHGPSKLSTYMGWSMLAAYLVLEGINGFTGTMSEHFMRALYGVGIGAVAAVPMWLLCRYIGKKFEGTPTRTVLRIFQLPGIIAIPIIFAFVAQTKQEYLYYGVFIAGFLTIGQFTFWGNVLPKLFPVHLRGTGESFAANIGGRLIGTSFAWVTATVSSMAFVPGATPQAKLAYTAAAVGMLVFVIGYLVAGLMPEPMYADHDDEPTGGNSAEQEEDGESSDTEEPSDYETNSISDEEDSKKDESENEDDSEDSDADSEDKSA